MFPRASLTVSLDTMSSLLAYLRLHHRFGELEEITDQALLAWLDKAKADGIHQRPATVHGYQWKNLFLPDGTRLRARNYETFKYASVEGDELYYEGRPVSPNQFNSAVPGITRNAWRDIFLLFPDARQWKRAADCRRQVAVADGLSMARPESAPFARPASPLSWDGAERREGHRRREDLLLD